MKDFLKNYNPTILTQAKEHLLIANEFNSDFENTLNYNAGLLGLRSHEGTQENKIWEDFSLSEIKESVFRGKYWSQIATLKAKKNLMNLFV